ncbi:helix-turn-helix domain-containing protein [Agromyces sp. NPDC058110]|uniref:helix-turn-helix domain-containing protein n=1 Tax=Agromyces sp. NPDC058110 TaxID=3346345 RepID=UPI0036DEBC42
MTGDEVSRIMERLPGHDVRLGLSQRGYQTARIKVETENIATAASQVLLTVQHGFAIEWGSIVSIELTSEAESELRNGSAVVPELVGVTEAARLLGRSPQAVRQMIDSGRLSAYRVGDRSFALVKSEVLAAASRRTDWKEHPGLLGVLRQKGISIDLVLPSPRIRVAVENDGPRRARGVAHYQFTALGRHEDPEGKIVSISDGQQELTEFDFTRHGEWTSPQ